MTVIGPAMVNEKRLLTSVATLARIGASPGEGITRVAFSEADALGRDYVAGLMRHAGMRVDVDAAGNMRGVLGTADADRRPVVVGSHLDTVPRAGAYDGAYGVLAGVEVAAVLAERGLDCPLVVVAFANEEGAYGVPMWGSRAATGQLRPPDVDHVLALHPDLPEALRRMGGDVVRAHDCAWDWQRVSAFVELHVEQGPELVTAGLPVAAVRAIVGRITLDVDVEGVTNHAGTTPMPSRRDALVAASEAVLLIRDLAAQERLVHTATVGEFEVVPGTVNVIPGRVRFTVDLRDHEPEHLVSAEKLVGERFEALGERHGVRFAVSRRAAVPGAALDQRVRDATLAACAELGVTAGDLLSGAGHDAQIVARVAPTGMIFVPSRGGVSHAPEESTDPEHLVLGTEVLLRTVLRLSEPPPSPTQH